MRRRLGAGLLLLAVTGCATTGDTPSAETITLAADVVDELARGAVLVDVRGPTERRRDGVPRQAHLAIMFGQDDFSARVSAAETSRFRAQIAESAGPPGRRLILLCSVGVRSAAAARSLVGLGYTVSNVMDGWLGNDAGPGLRSAP